MEYENQMIQALKEVLAQNYTEYNDMLQGMSKQELIEKSLEIASVREVYSLLQDHFDFRPAEVEHLLAVANPLHFLADDWYLPTSWEADAKEKVHEILRDLESPEYLKQFSVAAPKFGQTKSISQEQHPVMGAVTPEHRQSIFGTVQSTLQMLVDTDLKVYGKIRKDTIEAIHTQGFVLQNGVLQNSRTVHENKDGHEAPKSSVRKQLHAAAKEISQHPSPQKDKTKGGEIR